MESGGWDIQRDNDPAAHLSMSLWGLIGGAALSSSGMKPLSEATRRIVSAKPLIETLIGPFVDATRGLHYFRNYGD